MEPLRLSGLKDKSALVVGGGFGMGRATARLLSAHGARVCVLDADPERVEATSRELSATGITADIREPGAARDAVKQAATELGGLDILVNIVGKGRNVSGAELTAQTQREVFEINYLHHVEFCAAFGEHRLKAEKPGVITMVSSLAGLRPVPGEAAFGAAKAALKSLTTSLAVEWDPIRSGSTPWHRASSAPTATRGRGREAMRSPNRSRWADSATRRRSQPPLCSCAPMRPPTSPDRRCWSEGPRASFSCGGVNDVDAASARRTGRVDAPAIRPKD
jgi:NAD(P)-dependent dehydrogenase (short-subunit alcohol dehydrogenase family)